MWIKKNAYYILVNTCKIRGNVFQTHIFSISLTAHCHHKTILVNFRKYMPLIKTSANMIILSLSNKIAGKAMGREQISIHHVGLSNPAISEFCHPSYMAITLNNFKIFLSLLCGWSSHPTISKFCQFPTWKFFELLIRFKILFFGGR